VSVCLELTYACSWRCVFCYNARHHDAARLSGEEWFGVLDELRGLGTLWVALTGGDPVAHPDFLRIAQAARDRAFGLRVFTNGALVDGTMARRIARLKPLSVELSLHGATAKTHDRATRRAGSFVSMRTAMEHLLRSGARVVLKTPVTRINEGSIEDLLGFAERHGAEIRFDPTLSPRDGGDPSPLRFRATPAGTERVLSRLHSVGQLRAVRRVPGGTNCGLGQSTMAIDPEGNVYPCLQWREQALGNVREARLGEIWRRSPVRERVTGISRAANDALLEAGAPLSTFRFCPALAMQETGDPTRASEAHLELARAAARVCGPER
jgi:MoaA/NifB/PqqE/SkfB family radical SAM enzyme